MLKTTSHPGFKKGFTLIEMAVTILVIGVVVIGTIGFKYYSVTDAKKGEKEATATRIAMLLNEGWRGEVGDVNSTPPVYDPLNYNPTKLKNITGIDITYQGGSGAGTLGTFKITAPDNVVYYATMSYQPAEHGKPDILYSLNKHTQIALTTTVYWPIIGDEISYTYTDPSQAWSLTLTTYAEQAVWN